MPFRRTGEQIKVEIEQRIMLDRKERILELKAKVGELHTQRAAHEYERV